MSEEYKELVLAAYLEKRASGPLSPELIRPTPARLKKECLAVCEKRYVKKDEMALRSFFGQQDDIAKYITAIKKCDIDKFRPLRKFMDRDIAATDDKNIALLAWLIDFEPRPYQYGQSYAVVSDNQVEKEGVIATKQEEETFIPKQDTPGSTGAEPEKNGGGQKTGSVFKSRLGWMLLLVPVVLLFGLYLLLNKDGARSVQGIFHPGIKECMYWTGDQYEAIACDQKKGDTAIIAIDTFRLVHLKRINKPDTLTAFSLGKVWYIKLNGNVEFYTSAGLHPVYPDRRLKPLTAYMLNKYAQHK